MPAFACVPLPSMAKDTLSFLASKSTDAPPPAAVRIAVNRDPSINAKGEPLTESNTTTNAWITGNPLRPFSGRKVNDLIDVLDKCFM